MTDSFINFHKIVNIFLLVVCIILLIYFININIKVQNCKKGTENGNDEDNSQNVEKCLNIEKAIANEAKRTVSNIGFPYLSNFYGTIESKDLLIPTIKDWLIEEANVTKQYNVRTLQFLVQQYSQDDRSTSVSIPSIIAYIMVTLDLKRNEIVEKLFVDIVSKLSDPLKTSDYLDRHKQICYRVILQNYQKFNNLSLYQESSAVQSYINDTFGNAFKFADISNDLATAKLPDNLYRNKNSGEIGAVKNSKASGIDYIISLVEPLYYVGMSDKLVEIEPRKLLLSLFNFAYVRLRFTIRYNYVQIRGASNQVLSVNYKYYLLSALTKLYLYNPIRYTMTTDQFDMVYSSNLYPIYNSILCDYVKPSQVMTKIDNADNRFLDMLITSRSEGFTFFSYHWFIFEQCFDTSYVDLSDILNGNYPFLSSYMNYGCDFTQMFKMINLNDSYSNYYLPGQMLDANKSRRAPNAGSMVQLEQYLYYQSTYITSTLRVNGIVDGKTKTHRSYIRSAEECTYCLFAWYSVDYIPVVKHDEQYFLFDRNVRISLRCTKTDGTEQSIERPMVLTQSTGFHYSFFVKVPKDVDLILTVSLYRDSNGETDFQASQSANLKRINDYEISSLDSRVTVSPDKYKDKITMVKHKSTNNLYIIDDNTLLTTDSPVTATMNNVQYTFTNKSMSRFVVIPNS